VVSQASGCLQGPLCRGGREWLRLVAPDEYRANPGPGALEIVRPAGGLALSVEQSGVELLEPTAVPIAETVQESCPGATHFAVQPSGA
jgi:hypothetical protein